LLWTEYFFVVLTCVITIPGNRLFDLSQTIVHFSRKKSKNSAKPLRAATSKRQELPADQNRRSARALGGKAHAAIADTGRSKKLDCELLRKDSEWRPAEE
jgi:hypothetical protein